MGLIFLRECLAPGASCPTEKKAALVQHLEGITVVTWSVTGAQHPSRRRGSGFLFLGNGFSEKDVND